MAAAPLKLPGFVTNLPKQLLHEKKQEPAAAEGKRAAPKWDRLSGGPFSLHRLPCEAPAPVPTRSCWLLLFVLAVEGVPWEGFNKPCQGTRKAGSVLVALANVRVFTVPVGTLISHHQESGVEGNPWSLGTALGNGLLKLRSQG